MNNQEARMDFFEYSFFNPSPNFREMNLLKTLSETASISQERLARLAGIVPSMVNKYLKGFEEDGLISKVGENRRNMKYVLTDTGTFRLQFLNLLYLKEAARLYAQSRRVFGNVLDSLSDFGYEGLYLYGAGIVGGILAGVLRVEGIEPMGFIDDAPSRQDERFHDCPVFAPDQVVFQENQGVIAASFRHAKRIVENARKKGMPNIMVFAISQMGQVTLKNMEADR